jgi:predicted nucleic acid-binding protein
LDADVIVGYFDADDQHHRDAREIVSGADALAASVLSVAEAGVHAAHAGRLAELHAGLDAVGLQVVGLDAGSAGALSTLRADACLKMPDTCVLHAAQTLGAEAIGTRDERLGKAARTLGFDTP